MKKSGLKEDQRRIVDRLGLHSLFSSILRLAGQKTACGFCGQRGERESEREGEAALATFAFGSLLKSIPRQQSEVPDGHFICPSNICQFTEGS